MGVVPVRSPLLGESRLIPLPPGTEMFQFPGFASPRRVMTGLAPGRVAPFGHPGITACVPLPLAYRSLPRPSSPPCAQASPTCLRSLDYITVMKQSTRIELQSTFIVLSRPVTRARDSMRIRIPRFQLPSLFKQRSRTEVRREQDFKSSVPLTTCQRKRAPVALSPATAGVTPAAAKGPDIT